MNSIVLLHGALGCAADLLPLSHELQKLGFITHSLEFTGHGNRPFGEPFGIEAFCSQLEDFADLIGSEPLHVFGYSMGGYVALTSAARNPHLFGKLITLGTKFRWTEETLRQETALLDAGRMQQKVPAFAEALRKKHGEKWIRLLDCTRDLMAEITATQFLNARVLAGIHNNTLLGLGESDTMVSLSETMEVREAISGSQLYILPGAKHPIESVNHALLAEVIATYVQTHTH